MVDGLASLVNSGGTERPGYLPVHVLGIAVTELGSTPASTPTNTSDVSYLLTCSTREGPPTVEAGRALVNSNTLYVLTSVLGKPGVVHNIRHLSDEGSLASALLAAVQRENEAKGPGAVQLYFQPVLR